jgi:hypothetical protein
VRRTCNRKGAGGQIRNTYLYMDPFPIPTDGWNLMDGKREREKRRGATDLYHSSPMCAEDNIMPFFSH